MASAAIELLLIHGDPQQLRTAEISKAAVVQGGSANGLVVWRTEKGITLEHLENL